MGVLYYIRGKTNRIMNTVYIAGNPLVEKDRLPLEIKRDLQKLFPNIRFLEFDPTEEFPEQTMHIIDTVIGIDKVSIIDDIDKIVSEKRYSLHDFDLGTNLKLMKKLDKIRRVRIIGVPVDMKKEHAVKAVGEIMKKIF